MQSALYAGFKFKFQKIDRKYFLSIYFNYEQKFNNCLKLE